MLWVVLALMEDFQGLEVLGHVLVMAASALCLLIVVALVLAAAAARQILGIFGDANFWGFARLARLDSRKKHSSAVGYLLCPAIHRTSEQAKKNSGRPSALCIQRGSQGKSGINGSQRLPLPPFHLSQRQRGIY